MISSACGYNDINRNCSTLSIIETRWLLRFFRLAFSFLYFIYKANGIAYGLKSSSRGLKGLYEASQLSIEGEDILDEAGEFSRQYLTEWATHLDHQEVILITDTLKNPHHKSLARRWKDLSLANELKFARDQPLKWYMWPMACLSDPISSEQRVELTKPLALLYIIDDIFDICFKALYDITKSATRSTKSMDGTPWKALKKGIK
ncbi:(3S,6E)-nerolidol synthase 1 [Quercus suber]|uniref:(3S,6E)-nerolidol synthase 1 n=1 Tax=Quercus suber TaxID=58331 RepID=A0AAW0KCV1_QUESU